MTSLLPIIKDILPIIMPSKVHVTKSTELDVATGQTDGMVRKGAIIKKSNKVCASVMTASPHTSSAIHHHGEQDTIVYAASGHGGTFPSYLPISHPSLRITSLTSLPQAIISDNGQTRQELSPGDFALIPAWTEHQEVNDGEEEVTWIITRSGSEPVVVNLKGWGEGTKD
ncbi:hypothetical protein VTL71DRAFT_7615 [Oculimacula yallundae]|uniref:Cupin 2 conserved barrel domain-containing protein n=1 Tax=Oculimacula yallundae TaxID=86028 RepID=A0ABR4BUM0_9HELO